MSDPVIDLESAGAASEGRGRLEAQSDSVRAGTRLLLVSNDAMRARRRPLAILGVWLFQALLSLAVAWPITRGIAASYADDPRGDAALFADGGYGLLEWLQAERNAVASITGTLAVMMAIALVLGTVPLIGLLTSLAYTTQDLRAPRAPHLVPFLARSMWPMLGLLGLGGLATFGVFALATGLAWWADDRLDDRFGEARAGQFSIAIFFVLMIFVAVIGVIHDLARAAVIRFRSGPSMALRAAFSAFWKQKLVLTWSWAWRALVGLLLLGGAALVSARFGGRPGVALVVLMVLHQLVVIARVALRASWLARALRAVDRTG